MIENLVDVNGDWIGNLLEDGSIENKEEAFHRVVAEIQAPDGY